MKAQTQSAPFPLVAAVVAGIIGGIVLDAKLILVDHAPVPQMWQFIASTAFGQVAFSNVVYAAIGLCMHFTTSVFWALLYALVWPRINALRNWILGGVVWGVIAMAGMVTFLHFKVAMPWPGLDRATFSSLAGHTIFYGLPLAWYLARSARAV